MSEIVDLLSTKIQKDSPVAVVQQAVYNQATKSGFWNQPAQNDLDELEDRLSRVPPHWDDVEPLIQEVRSLRAENARLKISEKFALMMSEIVEAFEEFRQDGDVKYEYSAPNGKPEGVPVELADCVIRIMDFCGHYGIPLDQVIKRKHEYNGTREYMHGKKC